MPRDASRQLTGQLAGQPAEQPPASPARLPTIGSPTLILLRHGRTELNEQDKLQGSTDVDLDAYGQQQSRNVGQFIRETYRIDRVVTSPLKRAVQTVEYAGFGELPCAQDPRLAEIDYGEWETDPVASRASEMITQWNSDVSFKPPGGESLASMFERVSAACADLMRPQQPGTILVCSHATPIKAAVVWALGGAAQMILQIHSRPASITILAQTDFGRVLLGYNERPLPS